MTAASREKGGRRKAHARKVSVRDAVGSLPVDEEAARTLYEQARRALEGDGPERREATSALRRQEHVAPAALVPVVLAARDAIARGGSRPRGLARRVDALLLALAENAPRRPRRRRGGRRVTTGRAGRLLRRVLDLAPDGILTIRRSGRVGVWNGAGVAMTGRSRRALVRAGPASLFEDASELDRVLADLEAGRRPEPRETVLVGARSRTVPVRLFAAPLDLGDEGSRDADRHLLLFHDLQEVHRIRQRLIDTEKLSAMAKIAGSVAHEFRNPLNSLFLSTDLLEDELAGSGAPEESIAPTLNAIREEIERLNEIIRHYLSLSKVASHSPEIVDLGELVREFAGDWEARAAERGVELRIRVRDGDLAVPVDPNQVRRVLVNLVENAFDALTGEDGDERTPTRGAAVTLVVRPLRRSVKLTVRDGGPGIPEEIRDQVFEPFYTSKARGSGLGLYLVKEIVLAHGGAIALASNGGKGTSIAMHWPRPAEDAA